MTETIQNLKKLKENETEYNKLLLKILLMIDSNCIINK